MAFHRLRGSASPVLTATHHSYGSPKLSDFFPAHPWRSDPSTNFDAKWLKRRTFTQGWYFCSKNRNFSYPLISWSQNFANFWTLENFSLDLAFNIRGHGENNPYSEPNKSGIVYRQTGSKKLKYVLKFYLGCTHHMITRMRNDDLALYQWDHDVWGAISRKKLEIETWVQWTTNRKWTITSPMITWPMTSRDPKGQGRDPNMLRAQYLGNVWR